MTNFPSLSPLSPLGSVLIDINRSIKAKLYYPALLVSLTIPEICVALTLDNSVFVKEKHYTEFVDTYTIPKDLGVCGIDCYRLRGGLVHRANLSGHPKFGASHVVFSIPESEGSMHALFLTADDKTAAMLDLVDFCNAMIAGALKWYDVEKDNPKVGKNMQNLIRYCPEGVPPFFGGSPVVASGS